MVSSMPAIRQVVVDNITSTIVAMMQMDARPAPLRFMR